VRIPEGGLSESLCEDPRWAALVKQLGGKSLVSANLARSEVVAITENMVEVLFRGVGLQDAELEGLQPAVQAAFGGAFRLVPARDTNRVPNNAHTLAGRKDIRDAIAQRDQREAALADPTVARLRKMFPNSKVVEVDLKAARTDQSDDVQR
jgi:hypothetical protein